MNTQNNTSQDGSKVNLAELELFPKELQVRILETLAPEKLLEIALTSTVLHDAARDKYLWLKKFKLHFPHLYNKEPFVTSDNWFVSFKSAYASEYTKLTPKQRIIFSLVKECDVEGLKRLGFSFADFDLQDTNNTKLWQIAKKFANQKTLNYLYEVALTEKTEKNDQVYWAILLNQPLDDFLKDNVATLKEYQLNNETRFLDLVIQQGRIDILKKMLALDKDLLTYRNSMNETPLMVAAAANQIEIAKFLLGQVTEKDQNSFINEATNAQHEIEGKTALHFAAEQGHYEMTEWLIKAKADITAATQEDGYMPIHSAISGKCNVKVLSLLKSTVDSRLANSETSLMHAVQKQKIEAARFLIESGANVNSGTIINANNLTLFDQTALHMAIMKKDKDLLILLLDHGANINVHLMPTGDTPLHLAIRGGFPEAVEILLQRNADLYNADANGQTPIDAAIAFYLVATNPLINKEIYDKILLKVSQDEGLHLNGNRDHFIHSAASQNRNALVRKMLELNPRLLNLPNAEGFTPLLKAMETVQATTGESSTRSPMVDLLLSQPGINIYAIVRPVADLDLVNRDNNLTALKIAVNRNNHYYVKKMLEKGAEPYPDMPDPSANEGLNYQTLIKNAKKAQTIKYLAEQNNEPLIFYVARQPVVDYDLINYLLNRSDIVLENNGFNIIHYAAISGDVKLMPELLLHGLLRNNLSLINATDNSGNTPLMYAVMNGHNGLAERLIYGNFFFFELKADINITNKKGLSAVDLAVLVNNEEALDLLLRREDLKIDLTKLSANNVSDKVNAKIQLLKFIDALEKNTISVNPSGFFARHYDNQSILSVAKKCRDMWLFYKSEVHLSRQEREITHEVTELNSIIRKLQNSL